MSSAPTQQVEDRAQCFRRLHVLELVFVLLGLVLIALSMYLPIMMGVAAGHRSIGATFSYGYFRSLTPFVTLASLASTFIAAAVILSFEKSRPSLMSVWLGVLTLFVFAVEISLSLYLSLLRPAVNASTLFEIYLLIGLVPFGLACTMFTLASLVSCGWS